MYVSGGEDMATLQVTAPRMTRSEKYEYDMEQSDSLWDSFWITVAYVLDFKEFGD